MATKAQKVRLSVFLISSSCVLLLFFFILVGNRLLKRMDTYYIVYEGISVTGLEIGSAVKFQGVQVGRVSGLAVQDAASVLVEIQVERGTPIKEDTEAILTLLGITGLKFVEIIGGSVEAENLPPRSTITAGQSLFENISGQAEIILVKLEQVLNSINQMTGPESVQSVQSTFISLASLSAELDTLFKFNRPSLTEAITNFDEITAHLASTADKADSTMTALNTLMQSRQLQNSVSDINYITATLRASLDSLKVVETSAELHDLVYNANKMVVNYDLLLARAREDVLSSLRNLEETLDNLRETTDTIRENPSVLIRGRRTTGDRLE